jgi:hypothetical protein
MARKKPRKFARFYTAPFPNEMRPTDQKIIDREAARIRRENAEPQKPQPPQFEGMALGLLRPVSNDQFVGAFDALAGTEEESEKRRLDLSDLIS